MATYFHGSSEIQEGDGLQTLYLMNPNYVPYSDNHQQTNMFFLNQAAAAACNNSLNPMTHQHQNQNQHLVGIPLPGASAAAVNVASANSDDPSRTTLQETSGMVPRVHYNLWGSMDHQAGHPQLLSAGNSGDLASQLGLRRPVQQGLSLTLSSQQHAYRGDQVPAVSPASGAGEDHMRVSRNSPSSVSNGFSSMQSVLLGSKYLKATQELLDEVVNVGKGVLNTDGIGRTTTKTNKDSVNQTGEGSSGGADGRGAELSTAQRQELQMKKAKLVTMLDEVGQRYRQYHQQMQMVVSSFEQAAGLGSAKPYTALALQTISKQFRCLKDAISSQIKATSKSLGEDDCLGAKVEGSRLRQVDHHLRRQRALQQLGMIQHNAWRPQRGLPERAVSVLRAWLFEHFLHPYPKDSDKIMLAKQTGLTRSQVSNWFINARVRLWKPMVEEMYMEEVKEREQNGSEDNTNNQEANGESGSKVTGQEVITRMDPMKAAFQSKHDKSSDNNVNAPSNDHFSNSTLSASAMGSFQGQLGMFNLIGMGSSDMEAAMAPNKPRSSSDAQNSPSSILSMDMDMKRGEAGRDQFGNPNHDGGFGTYQMGDIGRFNVAEQLTPRFHGNGVSLTLGLPHCDMSGTQQKYLESLQLGRKLEVGAPDFTALSAPQPSHSNNGYESIDMQNRKRFATQLLPDFVS